VEEQQADPNSILNYYKQAMRLRNCFPAIARGTVVNFSPDDNPYVSVLKKTWQDESVIIVMNFDSFEQVITLDTAMGVQEGIQGGLYAQDISVEATYDASTGSMTLPPYSIVILK
jgi:glycosidase